MKHCLHCPSGKGHVYVCLWMNTWLFLEQVFLDSWTTEQKVVPQEPTSCATTNEGGLALRPWSQGPGCYLKQKAARSTRPTPVFLEHPSPSHWRLPADSQLPPGLTGFLLGGFVCFFQKGSSASGGGKQAAGFLWSTLLADHSRRAGHHKYTQKEPKQPHGAISLQEEMSRNISLLCLAWLPWNLYQKKTTLFSKI